MITHIKRNKTKLLVILGMALMLTALVMLLTPPAGADGGSGGDVIFNYPYNALEPYPNAENVYWTDGADHDGYDKAYKQELSEQYNNGAATSAHVVLNGDDISFFGYAEPDYMDYVFTEGIYTATYGNAFILRPVNMNFHSFTETGYLFNGTMSSSGYYTGYAIILQCENTAGMQENDASAPNTASLNLYYIKNEPWNTESFNVSHASTRTLVATFKTGIRTLDSTAFRVSVEIDPATNAFDVYIDGSLRASVSDDEVSKVVTGAGFGFYTGYYSHNCTILTRIKYEDITVSLVPSSEMIPLKVEFLERGTNKVIRAPETETGFVGQKYKVVQPKRIEFDGDVYYIVENSLSTSVLSDINKTYLTTDPGVIQIFYIKPAELPVPPSPAKSASVNGGEWASGTETSPVTAAPGSEIEYSLTVYAPPGGVPMIATGNSLDYNDTTWLGQTGLPTVRKRDVTKVVFVNLPEIYTVPSEFADAYSNEWDGVSMRKVWDVTYMDTSNPYRDTHKVFAWVTGTSTSNTLYLGGYGGVWLPPTPYQRSFYAFENATTIDLTNLHTETATGFYQMFNLCQRLTSLDLSGFDTSNATSMVSMFENCRALETIDLSSFDTSNVTNMNSMFRTCLALETIDLSNFDTSNVTVMSSMFSSCQNLETLDLRNFDTTKVTDFGNMFASCLSLESLDLRSFNTENATGMSSMFSMTSTAKPSQLKTIDLSSFDTSNVVYFGALFQGCVALETVDLSNFSTPNSTNMNQLFKDCINLKTIDLSNFDTSNVTTMQWMFEGCEAIEEIDLRWFDFDSVTYPTFANGMFNGCYSLKKLRLDSASFAASLTGADVFTGCDASLEVIVKDSAAKDWVDTRITASQTSIISIESIGQRPEPKAPVDWTIMWIPPLPPTPPTATDPGTDAIVTDVIPDGLTLVSGSITNGGGITHEITGGNTIKWTVPVSLLPLELSFKVTVDAGTTGDLFKNTAEVTYDGKAATSNSTYHKLDNGQAYVTEEYYIFGSGDKLDEDLITLQSIGSDYTVLGSTGDLYGYSYYGYRIGGSGPIIQGPPPAIPIGGNTTIQLYYKANNDFHVVTVHYMSEDGKELKAPFSEPVFSGANWYMQQWHLGSIDALGETWTYNDHYQLSEPNAGGSKLPGSPIKKDSDGPELPVFSGISGDMHVTLYFTQQPAVIVQFVEYGNSSNVLKDPETHFDLPFTPGTGPIATETGKTYTYVGYSTDGGATIIYGPPPSQNAAVEITLYYKTTYTVTEYYVEYITVIDENDDEEIIAVPILDPKSTEKDKGETFAGNPPEINGYEYKGYCFDSANNPYSGGKPGAFPVDGDIVIIYVYERKANSYTVRYDANGGSGTPIDSGAYKADDEVTVLGDGAMTRPGYKFTGWNTKADGSGTAYDPGDTFNMPPNDVVLYAQWEKDGNYPYSVTYKENWTGGTGAPTDGNSYKAGDSVSVKGQGSMNRQGYTFKGWNTRADGTGTMYKPGVTFAMPDGDVILYAIWEADRPGGGETYTPETDDDADTDSDADSDTDSDADIDNDSDTDSDFDTDADFDDDYDYAPVNNDRATPPAATAEGNTIEQTEDGIYVELDPTGVALGEWVWDDDLGDWIFNEYPPPLANMPQTGFASLAPVLAALGLTLTAAGLLLPIIPRKKERA